MRQTISAPKKYPALPFFSLYSAFIFLLSACNHQSSAEAARTPMEQTDSTQQKSASAMGAVKKKFTVAMVDNKKDPNCGMPVTAGIEDTVHYNGKVYGFCSDECKQAFLKNPDELAKNAVLK